MTRHFCSILALILLLAALTPAAHGQSITVSVHTTIEPGQAVAECSTRMDDSLTRSKYPNVITYCQFFKDGTLVEQFSCPAANPLSTCKKTYKTVPGSTYSTRGAHGFDLYLINNCYDPATNQFFQGYYDPLLYGVPDTEPLPEFTEKATVPAKSPSGQGHCWNNHPLGVANSFGLDSTTMQVSPSTMTLYPDDKQPFSSNINANWKLLSGPGTLASNTNVYQAPADISSQQTAVVQGCDVNNPGNCDTATITLEPVIVTVTPTGLELVEGDDPVQFSVSMNPSSFNPAVTWSKDSGLGTLGVTTGVYTAPLNSAVPEGGATVTVTAASTTNKFVHGTAFLKLAHVSAVNVLGSRNAMLASPDETTTFTAYEVGPADAHKISWTPIPSTTGTLTFLPGNTAIFAPAATITREQEVTIKACLTTAVCGAAPLTLVPLIRITSITSPLNAGESTPFQIKGTGFGKNPQVSFSDASIVFTPDVLQTDPDTLISGTIVVPILTAPESVTATVANNSSAISPPPGQIITRVNPVQITVSLFPTSSTVPVGQSQTFTPTVVCRTAGGFTCTIPPTVGCLLRPPIGTVTSGAACVYTATPPVQSTQLIQLVACSAVNTNACATAPITVPAINVTVTPRNITLFGGQQRTFSQTVTNNPNTLVYWSIIPDPLAPAGTPVGVIDQLGKYTAPNPITLLQTIKIQACSQVDTSRCDPAPAPVTLVSLTVTPATVTLKGGQPQSFSAATNGTSTLSDWSLDPPNNPAAGSITATGAYTAPAQISTVTKVTVIATSKADGSRGTATIFLATKCPSKCRIVKHTIAAANIGSAYSDTVQDPAAEIPLSYRLAGNLPPNLSFASTTGAIAGTPVQPPAVFGFAVTPVYSDGDGVTQQYALPVCQPVSAAPLSVGPFVVNTSISIPYVPGTNPPGMFVYSITNGTPPPGMGLDASTGTVSGVPNAPGTYTYTIQTSLAAGASATLPACSLGTVSDATYQVTISCDAACQIASVSPTSLTFAGQNAATTSPAQAVTLHNGGTGTMSITSITTSGDFAQTNNCGSSLAAGANCVISVTFTPTAAGTRTGTLSVNDNATGSPHTANLSGAGLAPAVSFSTASLTFAGQPLGTASGGQSVTLTNSGTGTLSITSITATGDFAQTNSCGISLASGASCIINVTFTPTVVGLRTGTLSVSDNAPGSPHAVSLSGAVVQGYHDVANCQGSAGWAWDSTQPNTPITVYIFDGSRLLDSVSANQYRPDLAGSFGNGYHGFTWTNASSLLDGAVHNLTIRFSPGPNSPALNNSPRSISCNPSVNALWIQPSALSWGPPNTLTIAGFATGGSGSVALSWRDVTLNGPWNTVAYQAPPNATDGGWSNTIPSPDNCHVFQATVQYSGLTANKDYNGVAQGYCSMRVIWIQPQAIAGFGPPGSLVVAGSATGGPSGAQVTLWVRDDTIGSGWSALSFAPVPDATGIWYNSIPDVDYTHQYSVYITYDNINSGACSYFGNGAKTNCP